MIRKPVLRNFQRHEHLSITRTNTRENSLGVDLENAREEFLGAFPDHCPLCGGERRME